MDSVTIVLILLALALIYLYGTRNHDFWRRRGVPGPRPLPLLGNILDSIIYSLIDLEQIRYKKYGKFYGTFEGNKPVLSVSDPEMVKRVLVKGENRPLICEYD